MNSDEFITKVCKEYELAKLQGFDSINIVVETSGGEYEISEYGNGFVNDNLDEVYSDIDEIASDLYNIINFNGDKVKGLRIE